MKKLIIIGLILINVSAFSQPFKFYTKNLFTQSYLNDTSLGLGLKNGATNGKSHLLFVSGTDTSYMMVDSHYFTFNNNIVLVSGNDSLTFTMDSSNTPIDTIFIDGTKPIKINELVIPAMGDTNVWRISGNDIYYDAGRVGIGTDSPETDVHFYNQAGDANYEIRAENSSTSPYAWSRFNFIINGASVGYFGAFPSNYVTPSLRGLQLIGLNNNDVGMWSAGGVIKFSTTGDGTERMRITDAGRVGIGTTTPTEILDVNGTINVGDSIIKFDGKDFLTGKANNILLGYKSGDHLTTGNNNMFLGTNSGEENITGNYNTILGNESGSYIRAGNNNTFIGNYAGKRNDGGSENTCLGNYSGFSLDNGNDNICIGDSAGYSETGSDKFYLANSPTTAPLIYGEFDNDKLIFNCAENLAQLKVQPTGTVDLSIATTKYVDDNSGAVVGGNTTEVQYNSSGSLAGDSDFTYVSDVLSVATLNVNDDVIQFSGVDYIKKRSTSLFFCQFPENEATSVNSTYVGHLAAHSLTSGDNNNFFGHQAGYLNTNGADNVFIGNSAGYSNVYDKNICIGNSAGYNNRSRYSLFLGYKAGYSSTTGNCNTVIGYEAGYSNTTGKDNIFLGYNAGYYETASKRLMIDIEPFENEANARDSSLIYGDFNHDKLTINGDLEVSGTIQNASIQIFDTATFTIALTDASTCYNILSTKLNTINVEEFTFVNSTGVITYTGDATIKVIFIGSIHAKIDDDLNRTTFHICKNGTECSGGNTPVDFTKTSSLRNIPMNNVISLEKDDYLELHVECDEAGHTLTIEAIQLTIWE